MFNSAGHYCPRCEKRVYFAEEIIAMGKHWHKSCFLCANPVCHKRLDSRTCTDHQGEAFCNHCYRRMFGPKGYGYGTGAGTLSMESNNQQNGASNSNVSNYSKAQMAPLVDVNGQISHAKKVQNSVASKHFSPSQFGSPDVCHRCGKTVYLAEKMMGAGSPWHKITCFTCIECNKHLESTSLCEKDGEIYCKTCYGRSYGPKGYGYGVGAGTLQMQQ